MSKFKVTMALIMVAYLITFMSPTIGLAHTNPDAVRAYAPPIPAFSEEVVRQRLSNLNSIIDIKYTPEVGRRIKEYTVSYRIAGEKILGKVDLYFPMFNEEISRRALPGELKYIAIVESNLDPYAHSKSGASGLWQFIPSTARNQGLRVNDKLDERRSPRKSTKAALEYLTTLYETFDDWTLAIAAYNCGPGGVKKAMKKSGSSDFWKLRPYLPRETQKYVPRVIAAMYLMQYYQAHELKPRKVDDEMKYVTFITDGKAHKFIELADELAVDPKIIMNLNPEFRNSYFPAHSGSVELVIPANCYERYLELYDIQAYKELLADRRQLEIEKMKEKTLALSVRPLERIDPILLSKLKVNREKQVFKTSFSVWEEA